MERKLATVLFVDLVDSTSLVTGADPEVVRTRVQTFFDRVSHCVITHGGIVEKFAGDAVMAAFGIPQAHEDDAERAVRAGLAILDAVEELGLQARVGVESGEVVADDAEATFATGEAVTLAARLEQAAEPGQLVLGPGAHRLTLGRIEVEELGPVELKGLDEPLWAWRAIGTSQPGGVRPRTLQAPLVGRDSELELLSNTYDRALRDRRAHLFTIYGEPGVGKSRLASEFVEGLEGATVLPGRSLPYGEGVTYWPLAEMVKCAAGIADDDPLDVAIEKLREFCEDEAVADLLGLASGVLEAVQAEASQQEIAWAAREDGGNPALGRGDDADGRRGGVGVRRPDPGHRPGAHRGSHRPASARSEGDPSARRRDRQDLLADRPCAALARSRVARRAARR